MKPKVPKVYVVMKRSGRGIYARDSYAHKVFLDKGAAGEVVKELNRKATSNHYWVEAVPCDWTCELSAEQIDRLFAEEVENGTNN